MTTPIPDRAALVAVATATIAGAATAAESKSLEGVIAKIKSTDGKVRAEAWQNAAAIGPAAIKPLASLLTEADIEVARAAKRGLWQIVHHVGRPGAPSEKKAATQELTPLLAAGQANALRREVLWMLSEIGEDESVQPVAALLSDNELREDARMVLQRIPGNRALAALKSGLAAAPEDFKPNVAESLRKRGVPIRDYPSQKLVPRKGTNVKPAQQI